MTFEGKDPPPSAAVSLVAPALEGAIFAGGEPTARRDGEGRFMLAGLTAGAHVIRLANELPGWSLKALMVDKIRDMVDTPLDLRRGQTLTNVEVVLSNRQGEVAGTITNGQSAAITDLTVLAFPTDATLWQPRPPVHAGCRGARCTGAGCRVLRAGVQGAGAACPRRPISGIVRQVGTWKRGAMSFCEHCEGQRFDRAQVLRVLRRTRRQLREQDGRRCTDEALTMAIRVIRAMDLPHLEPADAGIVH